MGIIKTRGILFHKIKYSESSLVIKVYTEELGIRTYMVRGARSKKYGGSLFQHLSLLNMEVYERESKDINHTREISPAHSYRSIPFDVRKSTVIVFLNEILYRSVIEEAPNKEQFEFLFDFLMHFDGIEKDLANQHLVFLVKLSRFLGFFPGGMFTTETPCFNLEEGLYQKKSLPSRSVMDEENSELLYRISLSLPSGPAFQISSSKRRIMLSYLLDYYRYHLSGFGEIRSHKILQDVFD